MRALSAFQFSAKVHTGRDGGCVFTVPRMAGSLTLIIETSTPQASMVLAGVDGVVAERGFRSDRSHNSMLFEPLAELLDLATGRAIDRVLVGSGPGSYSGTRVGIAAAQGVAMALGCAAMAVPSILAVAPVSDGTVCLAIGDARRGSYWTAHIETRRMVTPPSLCDAEELVDIITAAPGHRLFSFEDPSRFPLPTPMGSQIEQVAPDASLLWQAWLAADPAIRQSWAAAPPEPLYLKPPHITPAKPSPWRSV